MTEFTETLDPLGLQTELARARKPYADKIVELERRIERLEGITNLQSRVNWTLVRHIRILQGRQP